MVCTTLGLCTSTKAALSSVDKTQSSVECTVCKLAVGFLDKELSSQKTEAEAEAAVLQVCSDLGPLASAVRSCMLYHVHPYTPGVAHSARIW